MKDHHQLSMTELATVTGGDFKGFGVEIGNQELRREACGFAALRDVKRALPDVSAADAMKYAVALCNGGTSLDGKAPAQQ
jgi:hypothetical protein